MRRNLTLVIEHEDANVLREALALYATRTIDSLDTNQVRKVNIADQLREGIGEAERSEHTSSAYAKSSRHWISPRCGPA